MTVHSGFWDASTGRPILQKNGFGTPLSSNKSRLQFHLVGHVRPGLGASLLFWRDGREFLAS
jgi:hypothetical protein